MLCKVYQSLMFGISGLTNRLHAILFAVSNWRKAQYEEPSGMADNINIGQEIHQELQRQGRSVAWLSRQLGTSRMACYRIFDCYSIDTRVLRRISILLGRDFFKLYSESLDEEFGRKP